MTGARYTVSVSPQDALLGQDPVATLRCEALETVRAMTFEHASLVLELRLEGAPGEPYRYMPNAFAVHAEGRLIRYVPAGGVEELQAGQSIERQVSLLEAFPQVFGTGRFALRYRLEGGPGAESEEEATIQVRATPACIPHLAALARGEGDCRERAARLLRRLTGQIEASPEVIEKWWKVHGKGLRWPGGDGGYSLPSIPLSSRQKRDLVELLSRPEGLADQFELPPEPFVYEFDAEVTGAFVRAAQRMAARPESAAAVQLCRLAAKYPDPTLAEALRRLEPASTALLDRLLPSRVRLAAVES